MAPGPRPATVVSWLIAVVAAAGLGHALGGLASGEAMLWPPAGVLFALGVRRPVREWAGWLLAALAAGVMWPLLLGAPLAWGSRLVADGLVAIQAMAAAAVLQRLRAGLFVFRDVPTVLWLLAIAGGIVPLLGGRVAALMLGADWCDWWLSTALGALLLGPLLLTWARREAWRPPPPAVLVEALVLAVSFTGIALLVFGPEGAGARPLFGSPHVIGPFMLWGALRFGSRLVTLGLLGAASLVTAQTAHGHGPFAVWGDSMAAGRVLCQTFLLCVFGTTAVLSAFVLTQRRTRALLARAVERLREQAVTLEGLSGREAATSRLHEVGRLATGMAHDLNNLLTAVLGHSSVLREQADPRVAASAAAIEDAVGHAGQVTRDLLQFARTGETGQRVVDLRQVVDRAVRSMQWLAPAGVRLRVERHAGPLPVRVAEVQMLQALLNLADNAFEAMPEGGSLTIALRQEGDHAVVTVRDTGSGMSAAVLRQATQRYYTTRPDGHGIGLALAAEIMAQHDGRLELESDEGEGTCATLRLPLCDDVSPGTGPR